MNYKEELDEIRKIANTEPYTIKVMNKMVERTFKFIDELINENQTLKGMVNSFVDEKEVQ